MYIWLMNWLLKFIFREAERSNCFGINLLIGQKKGVQIKLSMKSSLTDILIAKQGSLLFLFISITNRPLLE